MINISSKHLPDDTEIIVFYYICDQSNAKKDNSYNNVYKILIDFIESINEWELISFYSIPCKVISARFMKKDSIF